MKTGNSLLFISLLFAGFSSLAQPYQPVAIENAHWFMFAHVDGFAPDHHAFVMGGDTLIGNVGYKKLYYQDLANQTPFEPPYLKESEHIWGVVRDDSLQRKVYAIAFEPYNHGFDCSVGEEQLLFDFSVLPGDTTAQCLTEEEYPWIMDSTYVSYIYGADRKTLYTKGGHFNINQPDEIYEGIGSRHGLLATPDHLISIAVSYYHLEEYCVGLDEDCGIISGVRDAGVPGAAVRLFPNPASDELNLHFFRPIHGVIRIYDAMGRLYWSGESGGTPDMKIRLGDWPPGIYLLQLEEEGRRYAMKFIAT
ncbi:MAG: T9SS type A sorting domain-containing protein [Saprospirales bacterium]|nr:T9SS type A sorting domain-containing protein [Saprospirales bacterium]